MAPQHHLPPGHCCQGNTRTHHEAEADGKVPREEEEEEEGTSGPVGSPVPLSWVR